MDDPDNLKVLYIKIRLFGNLILSYFSKNLNLVLATSLVWPQLGSFYRDKSMGAPIDLKR